ncbi:hypothetical protein RclHR1_08360005 [Rhizophagus clarus]|uniref:F-box domain-containing protein n=1 Tax=Rhizophagus clarus TaxID=94130 RepID=A0A2Z6SNC5_9GLOM|nr:hypothetical protein RclHR1_08360005 [Rhizophagus clarus]GET01466.1 hypothetical protein GLOIN_2v1784405 [Rhizophagus clarus]
MSSQTSQGNISSQIFQDNISSQISQDNMSSQLSFDCLNKILECLEEDKVTLHSCLLVNRLWFRVSVEILWKNIWNFKCIDSQPHDLDFSLKIFKTLISFLPNESIDFLYENGISIPTPTLKSPLLNYISFIKVVSISHLIVGNVSYNKILNGDSTKNCLIAQEILKMFMKQIYSLKKLVYCLVEDSRDDNVSSYFQHVSNFISFPGAENCLNNLSELRCGSDINTEFFHQLTQLCHNIHSLRIHFCCISKELEDLIFSQKSLKSLSFIKHGADYYGYGQYGDYFYYDDNIDNDSGDDKGDDDTDDNDNDDDDDDDGVYVYTYSINLDDFRRNANINVNDINDVNDDDNDSDDDDDGDHHHKNLNDKDWPKIASLLTIHSNTLTNLLLEYRNADFKELQHIAFPQLRILKLVLCPDVNMLIRFLEINGRNLKEFYVNKCDNSLNLAIAEFCPNLKSLHTLFPKNEIEVLKIIFESCQQLESFLGICGNAFLGGKKLFEAVVKYSPESFRELKLHSHIKLGSKDLQSFFTGWKRRIPRNPVSLIISEDSFKIDIKTGEMIANYRNLGIIKKFETDHDFFINMYNL